MPGPGDPVKPLTAKDLNPSTGALRNHGVILGGQSQSKYDATSTLSDLRNINAYRAANQGYWDAFANTGMNLLTTLGGQVVQSIGAFSDPIMEWMGKEDMSLNEGLMGVGNDIMQYGQNKYPVYYDPSKGYNVDYFLSNLPNFASNVAMLIPGWGMARGLGVLAKMSKLGALGTTALQVGIGAATMRRIEAMMEASQVYNQLIKEGVSGMDPRYKNVGYDEIKTSAEKGAADDYNKNKLNLLFDIVQMGALMMPIKGLTGWGKNLVGVGEGASKASQVLSYGYKALVEKGLIKDASKLSRMGLKSLNMVAPFYEQLSEGIEEMVNYGAQQEGLRTGRIAAGVEEDDGSTVFDRIKGYMGDAEMWESGAWGVLGGMVFHAGGQKLNQIGAKAGWWNDTTKKGQLLQDLKVRADVISNGYKQLQDPNLTEYEKGVIKGQMLFNLVQSNKSRESLDMLKEDLNDQKMVKHFAGMMGFSEEDAKAEMEILRKDIDFINDKIDYYTGDTLKNWFGGKPKVHEGVGMEGDKTITTPGVGRSGIFKGPTPTSVHYVFDPKVAQQLAYNDYTVRVKDRLSAQATGEIAGIQKTVFQGTEHDANSQMVFNTISDITALNHLATKEREELENRKARGLSEVFIKASENKVKKVDDLLGKREKQLKALEETMNANTEAKMGGTTFAEADKYANEVLGAKEGKGKYADLKAMNFGFMLDKEEALLSNNRILQDPTKYVQDYMESSASNKIFEDMRAAEADRVAKEQATIDSAIAELEKESNEKYNESKQRHGEAIAQGLSRYATPADKEGYLMREKDALIADYNEDVKAGKFKRGNLTEFSTQFDKNKYSDLKARESVINAALKEYQKETTTVGTTAKPGAAVDPVTAPVDKTNIVHMPTEPGTAANYWKGMVNKFGADGKSGTFHTQYLNGDGGVTYTVKTSDRYRTNIDSLTNILSRYETAKKDGGGDPMEILKEAKRFLEFRSWPTKVVTEATVYSTIVEDLQKQEADLTKMDTDLMLAPIDSKMWMLFVGMSSADVARMQAASDADVANIKHGKLDEIPSTFSRYPELYPFAKSLITPYTDTHQLFDDIPNIEAKILAEVKRAKEAYETGAAQETKVPNKDINNQDPDIHSIMDQKADVNDDSALATHAPMSDPVTHPDNPVFAGILGESIVQLEKNTKGSYEPVYLNGKQQPNPKYDIGHTIYVGPNGETMNGYVKRGTPIIVEYTGRNVSKDIDEKELIMTDEKGRFLGYVDNVDRLTKSNATYQSWVDDPKTSKKKKKEYRGRIKKNEALIPYYNKLRARFAAAGQKLHGNVANQITTAMNVVESGGVRYGRLIDTERNNGQAEYMDIAKSFGLSQINRPGKVFLVMYVDGDMVTWNPKSNTYEAIYTVQKKMSVPTFALNPKILQGKGTLNGSIFAMIPTNTLDSNGDHIYVSAKMYTRLVTNIKMTSDGKPTGKTIPEQMLDVITNPDTHREEFTMLAAQLGIYFDDKTAKLTDMKNRDTLLKFYTTDNLVKLFNKIIYVYNPEVNRPVDNIKDLSHQIGVSVYVPKPAADKNLNHPAIKFNLSNTQSDKTTYFVNLFKEDGTFEASFENKPVAREKRVTAEQKKTMTPEQLAEISFVSGKGQIYARLRDKMVRVDKVLLARTSDKLDYKAIVFSGGRLVEQNYNSYLDYLADKQILDSTIHGLDFKATDPDTGVEQTGRTYFKDRTFWVDIPDGEAKAAKADISVKATTSERVSGDPVIKEEPKKEVKPVVPAPVAPAEVPVAESTDVKNIRAKVEGIVTAPGYVKDTAQKHLPKEVNKIRQATQFIGTGEGNDSTTQRMEDAYKTVNAANTGVYTADDLIYVSSNGRRGGRVAPVVDGKLNSSYVNIEKAMAAGASFIMDTGAHLAATRNYNMGEAELAQYMQDNGYVRDTDKDTGIWRPKAKTVEVIAPVVTAPVVTPAATAAKEEADRKARETKAAELQKELNDANKELSDLVNILEALEKKPEVTAEVAEVVENNVTQKEVAAIIAEEPTITTTAQAQAAVTQGVVEDIAAGKEAKKRGTVLQRVINKIKKIIVSLFAAGTLFTGITGFTSTSDGVTFDFNKTIEASLSAFPQTTQEMAKRYLEKKGIYESTDYKVEVVEDIEEVKEPVFHEDGTVDPKLEVLAAVPDSYNPTDSLLVYRSTWNNKDGFKYIPGPNRSQSKSKNNISGVIGVGHFLLDASLYNGKEYTHENNKAFLATAKAKNDYVPAFKRLPGGMVEVKYKRYANLDSLDIVLSPLRQYPVSSINWLSQGHAEGFKDNIKEVKRTKGEGTYLIFKTRDGYSRFSGGSVVFLFTKNGNEIVVDFAGSLNMIQKEAERIVREFEIPAESLTLGYHDVGSFSAKPKAQGGVIRGRQYYGYNDEGFTGGSLLIPMPEQVPAKEPKLPAGITSLSVLLAGIRRKQKAGQPITDDDIAKVKARIAALNTRINDIQKELSTLKEPVGSAASLIKGNDSVPLTQDNLVQERDHAVYMYLQSLDKHGFGDLTTEETAEMNRIMRTYDEQILALENMYIDQKFPPFTVPAALQRSIDARKPDEKGNVNIKLMGDGPDSYWKVFGLMHERVSSILRPSKGARKKTDAMEAGKICDTTYKKLLTGDTEGLDTSNFTAKALEQITQAVEDFKQHMAAKDQRLASPDVVVYGDVKDSKGVTRKVAGEIDIMTVDRFNHFYVYDQKTSTKPFDLATYQSINVEAGTGKSDYDMHHEQVSSYSALGSHMTGDEAGGVGIIPGTLAYSRKAGKLIIDAYEAYPTMMYKNIKAIPDIPIKPKDVKTKDFSKVQGESNKNRKKNIMLNEDLEKEGDEVPETHENWGDDSKQPFVAPTKIDLAKFRDMRVDLHEQYEHEDFVGQLMLDFMHEDRDRRGPDAEVQSNTLFEGTRAMLEDYIREFNVMLRDSRHRGGVLQPDDTRIPLTPQEDAVKVKQIAEMQKLAEGLDETPEFIGYFKLGLMRLSSDKIIKLNIDLETLRVSGADEQDFSVRYQDNYSAKIDPKTTVLDQAKLFLSRIWETNRTVSDDDQIRFNNIPNRFGIKKYFNLDRVLDSMYIEFENVAPESFMDRLKSLNNDNPVVHSIIKTLEDVATEDPVRSKQLRYQLTGLMKQRRDQKFMKITTNEDGSVKEAKMIEAARLGIKNNIFGQWDNGFRERFPTLYNFEESNDNLRDTAYTAVAKPLDLNYAEKGKTYDALDLKLPEGFDTVKYVTEKQIDWLYKELKTIAYGNSKKHMVFKFDWNSQLVVADKVMKITKQDVAMLMLSLPTSNFILTEDIKKMFPAEKQDLVADTIMRQLANTANYFSRIELKGALHEGSDWDMDLEAYPNIYYKIISDQFDRMGIQLSEKKDESWTVLRSMNNSISTNGKRRVFNNFDSKAANFNQFLNTTFRKQIIEPLLIPGIFNVGQQEFIDEDAGDLTAPTKSLTVEQPLSHSLQGMDPYARHARSEWYSYINATIRNTQGDREWTYTDPNGLSTAIARLKDHKNKSGLLVQLASTPMGRYNLFLQELVRSPEALEAFTNHYIDAGKMDNYTIIDPANLNAAKSLMMLFNTYYHNETGTVERNKGGFITTHSDSSLMPTFMFGKQVIGLEFHEVVAEDGTHSYKIKLPKLKQDLSTNLAYDHLYGIFRGELQRIYETFQIYKDINRTDWTDQQKVNYAFSKYEAGINFIYKDGKIYPGNGINLFTFGNKMFEGDTSGIYSGVGKTGIHTSLIDASGHANEAVIEGHFQDKFLSGYLNDLLDQIQKRVDELGTSFFETIKVKELGRFAGDTKTLTLDLKAKLLDQGAFNNMRKLFERNSTVVSADGRKEAVGSRKRRIEKDYDEDDFSKEFESKEYRKMAVEDRQLVQDDDMKTSTYATLLQKYILADFVINNAIFLGSVIPMLGDPASYDMKKYQNYKSWQGQFDKRMRNFVAPGGTNAYEKNDDVYTIGFEDIKIGDILMDIDDTTKLTRGQQHFLSEWDKNIGKVRGRYPARMFDQMVFYYNLPPDERYKAWDVIKDMLNKDITDGGSYISTREFLFRQVVDGKISDDQYWDALDAYYGKDKKKLPVANKILKYVLAGSNVTSVGEFNTNKVVYQKHAETTLIPELFEDSVLDEVRKQLDVIETRLYQGRGDGKPTPGIVLAPKSAFKVGYPNHVRLIDENGNITQELLNAKVHKVSRSLLRKQIQSQDEAKDRGVISSQGNVLGSVNTTADQMFGQDGHVIFDRKQNDPSSTEIYYDDDNKPVRVSSSGVGITAKTIDKASIATLTQMSRMKMIDKMYELGLTQEQDEIVIKGIDRFLATIKKQAVNLYGIGSTTASFLNTVMDGGDSVLPIPVSFTPGAKRIQSVLLSEFKEIFYRFTLPGGALTQYANAMNYKKDSIKADKGLKHYRMDIHTSEKFDTEAEAYKRYPPEQRHSKWDPVTGTLEYYKFSASEVIIPWPFKGLNFDDFCEKDGTPKKGRIDERLLHLITFRIPNTGPNSSGWHKVVKFTRPGMGDGISAAPEHVATIGADSDFDKLYTYLYNHKVVKDKDGNSVLMKEESALHYTQRGSDFKSPEAQRQYAKNKLMVDPVYRRLKYENKQAKAQTADLNSTFATAVGQSADDDLALFYEEQQMIAMEDAYMNTPEFGRKFARATIQEKQSMQSLENAMLDRFHAYFSDYKTLKHMTDLVTTEWLNKYITDKVVPIRQADGTITKVSIEEIMEKNEFHAITSAISFNDGRLGNTAADLVISMSANGMLSNQVGQQQNFFYNTNHIPEAHRRGYEVRFYTPTGELKEEDPLTRENSTYQGIYNPHITKDKKKNILEDVPALGLHRLDRIYAKDDEGNKVYITTPLGNSVQTSLDHQNVGLLPKINLNPTTYNGFHGLSRFGLISELVPSLLQESVVDYTKAISGFYAVKEKPYKSDALIDTVTKFATSYGYDRSKISSIFYSLPDSVKNGPAFVQAVMDRIDPLQRIKAKTEDLLIDIAIQYGWTQKDNDYGLRQLEALRHFLIMNNVGTDLNTTSNATSAYRSGLNSTMAGLDMQDLSLNHLHQYQDGDKKIVSSAPLVGGKHRLLYKWAKELGRKYEHHPSMASFGHDNGVVQSKQMLASLQGKIFTEFTPMFEMARKKIFWIGMGANPKKSLADMRKSDYEHVFNKVNVNLVAFIMSNPNLYRNLFQSQEEYNLFETHRGELMSRPHKDIPYQDHFILFNKPVSLAKELHDFARKTNPSTGRPYMADHEALVALKSRLQVSYKTPSSVTYDTNFGYNENVNMRIALSLMDMYFHGGAEAKNLVKKLIINAYMSGGITTTHSYVQFIAPEMLFKFQFHDVLRGILKGYNDKAFIEDFVDSYVLHYFQHFPFEMKGELDMQYVDGDEKVDSKGVPYYDLKTDPRSKKWALKKTLFRKDHRMFVKSDNGKRIEMVDNLGMSSWNTTEFRFNTEKVPGNSLYASNITNKTRIRKEGIELEGEIRDDVENINETEASIFEDRKQVALFDKVVAKPTSLDELITDIEVDGRYPMHAGVLDHFRPLFDAAGIKVEYSGLEGQPKTAGQFDYDNPKVITINTNYSKFKGLEINNPDQFNMGIFVETVTHEGAHALTYKTVYDVKMGIEKDPKKIQAVERLEALVKSTMKYIRSSKELSEKYPKLMDMGKKVAKYYNQKIEDTTANEIRLIAEFISHTLSVEGFQEDLNGIILKGSNDSVFKQIFDFIMELLGLNIDTAEAQTEIKAIQRALTPGVYYAQGGLMEKKAGTAIPKTIKNIKEFSALHVALREILNLRKSIKGTLEAGNFNQMFQTIAEIAKENSRGGQKLNYEELYSTVPNFDPSWSPDMKEAYHRAASNGNIIC